MKKRKTFSIWLCIFLILCLSVTAGCKSKSDIGDMTASSPIMALMFEMGQDGSETGGGVIYRKVNNIERVIAKEKVPVLVVFMDGRALSNSAIPFTEELCDRFSETARIIRVNVELIENTEEVDKIKSMFEVRDYPWFAVTYMGEKKAAISGYSEALESEIIRMIENAGQ